MKTVNVEIELLEFDELGSKPREYAIREHRAFLILIGDYLFDEDFVIEEEEIDYLVNDIKLNEYSFYANGDIADVKHYCGKHEKAGTSELKLNGKIYQI